MRTCRAKNLDAAGCSNDIVSQASAGATVNIHKGDFADDNAAISQPFRAEHENVDLLGRFSTQRRR